MTLSVFNNISKKILTLKRPVKLPLNTMFTLCYITYRKINEIRMSSSKIEDTARFYSLVNTGLKLDI